MAKLNRPLPSEHETARMTQQVSEQTRREEEARQTARLRNAFDWLLKQENGRLVWAWLFLRCGYNKSILAYFTHGDVAPIKTEVLAAVRELYLDLRKLVPPELLAKAEYEAEFGVVGSTEKGDNKNG